MNSIFLEVPWISVPDAYPRVRPLLEKFFKRDAMPSEGFFLAEMAKGRMTLFIEMGNDGGILSAVVAQLSEYDDRKVLEIPAFAGRLETVPQMMNAIREWAKEQGATEEMIMARPGLKRYLEPTGLREISRVFYQRYN